MNLTLPALARCLCITLLLTSTAAAQDSTPDRGWNALADVLDRLTPSADTSEPPSGAEVHRAIAQMLERDRADAALAAIEKRQAELALHQEPGQDVQLLFLKARALAQLGRVNEAQAVYRDMTVRYPELAEPWNNSAILYIGSGDYDQALMALEMAVMTNPGFASAVSNLADLRLLMALRDYERAASLGDRAAAARATALQRFIKEVSQP